MPGTCLLAWILMLSGTGAPAAAATRPDGPAVRTFTRSLNTGSAEYDVHVGGALDAFNTHIYADAYRAAFQPNAELIVRNVGDTPVKDPRITINGTGDWCDQNGLLTAALGKFRNGTEEEKCFALWDFFRRNIDAGPSCDQTLWGDTQSVVRFMNCFGSGACGTFNRVMPLIGRAAGLDTRTGCLADCSHAVQAAHYAGADRYFDTLLGAGHVRGFFCLDLDNRTLSSVPSLMADPYLVERAGGSPGFITIAWYFGPGSSFHTTSDKDGQEPRTLDLTLRPGEAILRTWASPREDWHDEAPTPPSISEGRVVFEPRLTLRDVQRDAETRDRLVFDAGRAKATGPEPAVLIYSVYSPYVIIGAAATAMLDLPPAGADVARILLSTNGRDWTPAWKAPVAGRQQARVERSDLKAFRRPHLTHRVWYRLELPPGGKLESLRMEAIFQSFIPSLPTLRCGRNRIVYHDATPGEHRVEVTHRWRESSAFAPPGTPPAAIAPADGGEAGFAPVFEWKPPDGRVEAYEFLLSPREDCAWPVLASFQSVVPGDLSRFTPPTTDALNDQQRYWWRVRARAPGGVWGSWSKTWAFTARGPGRPQHLRVQDEGGREFLVWDTPSTGRPPVRYDVYADSDSALSPRRESISVTGFGRTVERPASLLLETPATRLEITGRAEAWYRLVAVDAAGSRSAPTPIVAARRPIWLPVEPPPMSPGSTYRLPLRVRHSTGRWVLSLKQGVIRHGADVVRYQVINAPSWLDLAAGRDELVGTVPADLKEPVKIEIDAKIDGLGATRQTIELPVGR